MLIYNTKVITLRQHFFKKFFQIIFLDIFVKKCCKKSPLYAYPASCGLFGDQSLFILFLNFFNQILY
ncbi:MAG TPA: hypothetical protein DCG51_12780 [Erysipelotrichaceae bacterium]|nr:hypothetical protein [Erysipelotrichaceae bacterium]